VPLVEQKLLDKTMAERTTDKTMAERTTDKTMAERTTDKTMAERKRTEEQTTIYKSVTGHLRMNCNWNGTGNLSPQSVCQLCSQH
jgi:hypothetical protein